MGRPLPNLCIIMEVTKTDMLLNRCFSSRFRVNKLLQELNAAGERMQHLPGSSFCESEKLSECRLYSVCPAYVTR